jgi:phospholipid-binding lipoprotein MlaA
MAWFKSLPGIVRQGLLVALVGGVLGGCAANGPNQVFDPFEPVNRHIFAFNDAVDTALIRPVAVVYRDLTPRPVKSVVSNFISHLTLPLTMVHDLLQGKPDRAQVAFGRFFMNTILGVGGLFDVATAHGLKFHDEDMGQTLAVHGSGPGPYLVLPLLGPSNMRDGIGDVIDRVIDPVNAVSYLPKHGGDVFRYSRTGASILVARERLIEPLDALHQSLDYYAAVRAAYSQKRKIDIKDGKIDPAEGGTDPFKAAEEAGKSN